MSRSLKALAAVALVGGIFSIAATPALASKPSNRFYAHYRSAYVGGTPPVITRALPAMAGEPTRFLGGWGCDYYFYPQYAPRRC